MSWMVVGVSGVTCGGKTTLAQMLYNYFLDPINVNSLHPQVSVQSVKLINQDKYFLPESDPRHQTIEHLNHKNWELPSALDMTQMCEDVRAIIGGTENLYEQNRHGPQKPTELNILIIEGFVIFNVPLVLELCHLKFHLHLPYEKCYARRKLRTYDPPDVVGYFEACVWPMYIKHFNEFQHEEDLHVMNGELSTERVCLYVLNHIRRAI